MSSEKLVLLAQDGKTISLAVIPAAASSEATATFRLIVEQRYRSGGAGGDANEVDKIEDVVCRVAVGELCAAAVDRAFEDLVARLEHPTLRPEVATSARDAAARVRARYAEEVKRGLSSAASSSASVSSSSTRSIKTDSEETGSDLELDEESWAHGWRSGSDCQYDQDPAALISDDEDGAQFSARPYDGALAREGGPSDGTLLLSGFQARSDGPELADQHELTPRDVQRLVRLAFDGGDVDSDDAYQRALAGRRRTSVSCHARRRARPGVAFGDG